MNRSQRSETEQTRLEKHLRVLQDAPAPDLARGRARVLAEMEKRRARASQMPRRVMVTLSMGTAFAVMLLMVMAALMTQPAQATAVSLTRTDTAQAETFAPLAQPGNALTPSLQSNAPLYIAQTPAPNIVPEPPRSTNTRATLELSN